MFPVAIWFGLCMWVSWKGGLSQGSLPAPYRLWGATGAMAFAMVVGMMNKNVGNMTAVALALGAVLYYQSHPTAVNSSDSINLGNALNSPNSNDNGPSYYQGGAPFGPSNLPPGTIPGTGPKVGSPGVH